MGIEQHLVRLQRIGPHQKSPAVRKLGMGNLKFEPLTTNRRPVFAPVKLEGVTGLKDQRNVGSTPGRLLRPMAIFTP